VTRDEVILATREASGAAEQLAAHLDRLCQRLAATFPLDEGAVAQWGDAEREQLHAMLRMFDQLFDLTSRKLLRGLLFLSGETVAGLSAQNQFRRVEAIGGLPSAERWLELGTIRNILAHDYPTRAAEQAARANLAWAGLPDLIAGARRALAYLDTEGLIR
jgi:hypothetical protein